MQQGSKQHWSKQTCQHYAKEQGILTRDELQQYLQELGNDWRIARVENKDFVLKEFKFKRYIDVLAFVNRVGEIAEKQNHHPDMLVKWSECGVYFHTHSAGGITLNDVICAYLTEEIA